jgi:hypothetical protein
MLRRVESSSPPEIAQVLFVRDARIRIDTVGDVVSLAIYKEPVLYVEQVRRDLHDKAREREEKKGEGRGGERGEREGGEGGGGERGEREGGEGGGRGRGGSQCECTALNTIIMREFFVVTVITVS